MATTAPKQKTSVEQIRMLTDHHDRHVRLAAKIVLRNCYDAEVH